MFEKKAKIPKDSFAYINIEVVAIEELNKELVHKTAIAL